MCMQLQGWTSRTAVEADGQTALIWRNGQRRSGPPNQWIIGARLEGFKLRIGQYRVNNGARSAGDASGRAPETPQRLPETRKKLLPSGSFPPKCQVDLADDPVTPVTPVTLPAPQEGGIHPANNDPTPTAKGLELAVGCTQARLQAFTPVF